MDSKAETSPAYQFYAADWLADTASLTTAQEGIYIRLLSSCWRAGYVSDDPQQALMLCKRDARVKDVAFVLKALFQPSGIPGRLASPMLERERLKQAERRRQTSEAGQKSAAIRRRQRDERSTSVEPNGNGNSTLVERDANPAFASSAAAIPLTPNGGIDDFNADRRRRDQFKPIGHRDESAVKAWIGLHSESLIPRDFVTVSKIVQAAAQLPKDAEFYQAVAKIAGVS